MAIWPFNRKKNHSSAPIVGSTTELYEGEHREQIGIAWFVAFLSLLVTVAVLSGAFLGGRWAYRKVVKKPANKPTTSQEEAKPKGESQEKDSTKDGSSNGGSAAGANSGKTNAPQTSSSSTTTPQVATPSAGDLPNTGPSSDE